MKIYTVLIVLLLGGFAARSQPFVNIASGLPAMGRSAVAFADLDNDNDLDVIMTGLDQAYNPSAKVFLNDEGTFVETVSGISGVYNSALDVADYDHDGYMDVVVTGQDQNGYSTTLYKNNGNAGFTAIDAGFIAAGSEGDLKWGDYDNDGWADLIVSGGWNTALYHNNGDGTFVPVNAGLTIMNSPSVDWGDFDNDGDLDLLMVGDAGSVAETYIYINDNGVFNRLDATVEGTVGGAASWGDYDNDGNLDILITGLDVSLIPVSYIYRNNGDKTFSFANAGLIGTALGPSDWIDFDNDGDADIMLAGENGGCGNASTRLYTNNGAGDFYEFPSGLPFVERASSAWGDYDNDGDYDLLLTGLSVDPITRFYRNDILSAPFQENTAPGIPGDLYTYVSGDYAVISWSRVSDLQSPESAITYNVMMGTQSGAIDVVSPQSDPESGIRYVPSVGNTGSNDFMIFRGLEPGTYYFRVQAVDQAFSGSPFSEEGSFTVLPTGIGQQHINGVHAFFRGNQLLISGLGNTQARLEVAGVDGKLLYASRVTGDVCLPAAQFARGICLVRVIENNKVYTTKLIR